MANAERVGQPKPITEIVSVFDFLDQVRLRPGVWVRGSSLQHLESMLLGYRVALEAHGIDESFDFWPLGPFSEWLWQRLGRHSALGWAVEIEREAATAGREPLEMFFELVDEYRATTAGGLQG
jgi:hypothetical protein